uniref:Paxillin n=1 Tax=Oncorhynchus tshawytscha TaxID=74940 RepID=A0A8C8HQ54_ONCTS
MLSSHQKSLVVLNHSKPSPSTDTSPPNAARPSLTSASTTLDQNPLKSPSPSLERGITPPSVTKSPSPLTDMDLSLSTPTTTKSLSPVPFSYSKSPTPLTASKAPSPSLVTYPKAPPPPALTSPMISRRVLQPVPAAEPSLDEALDKLLAMRLAKIENDKVPMEAPRLKREVVHEKCIMPLDRREVQPDTTGSTRNGARTGDEASTHEETFTRDGSVISGHVDGYRELMDWADVELNMCLQDGLDGGMTPNTERPYTDGSMTPTTEASWMDESLDGSSCPGTPDASLDLPLLQQATVDRVSASGHMAQGKGGPGGPPTQVNKLDNMLGSLQSDLHKLGVQTVAKGVCGACCKPIVGQVVTAMGRTWHPEHFVCTHCQEEIGSRNFFERDGAPYCEKDYHNLFSPRCHYCNGPILDKVVTALDRTWHPEHFFCAQCGSFFGPEGFHEKDGKAYCRKDYFDMFAPKCGGCARAILENYISALNSLWHPECFVCRECFTPFVNGSFFEHDGQPYCEVHYHERRGSLCSGCQKPITGRCITAMAKKFHPEHFVCAFCLKQLNKGTFKEQNDKPYCQGCFVKLFS